MTNAETIIKAIGRRALRERLGVLPSAISNASAAGTFPAAWYLVVSEMARERGIEVPLSAFRWRAPS